jgi:hypothetical protein
VSAAIIIAAIAFFGLSLGSFSSAIAYRLPRGESWIRKGSGEAARSRCPNCSTQLTLFDLVPVVSWVALRGKCRYCQAKISPLYPALELLGGALAVLFFFTYGASLLLLLALGLLPFFLAVLDCCVNQRIFSSENGSCPCCALCSAEYGGACLFPLGFWFILRQWLGLFVLLVLRDGVDRGAFLPWGLLSLLIAAWLPLVFIIPFFLLFFLIAGVFRLSLGGPWAIRAVMLSFLLCLVLSLGHNAL